MKKIFFILVMIFGLFCFASCSKGSEPEKKPEEQPEISSKAIVVFYSATNNTRRVSNIIASHLNTSTFELVPVEPYSSSDLNYNDSSSRVSREHTDSNRHVELTSTTIPAFDTYDTIFIGYPIWWGEASWVLDDFVKKNDFTGKTVIPFATSASSPLGDSAKNLAAKSTTGTWLAGIRFRSSASESEITDWVDGLNLQ